MKCISLSVSNANDRYHLNLMLMIVSIRFGCNNSVFYTEKFAVFASFEYASVLKFQIGASNAYFTVSPGSFSSSCPRSPRQPPFGIVHCLTSHSVSNGPVDDSDGHIGKGKGGTARRRRAAMTKSQVERVGLRRHIESDILSDVDSMCLAATIIYVNFLQTQGRLVTRHMVRVHTHVMLDSWGRLFVIVCG